MKDAIETEISLFVEQLENVELDLRELHSDQPEAWKETKRGQSVLSAYYLIRQAQLALLDS